MGKSFISLKTNNIDLESNYNKLFSGTYEIIEASNINLFRRIAQLKEIKDIELGCDGTEESIIRLNNNDFQVINKTIEVKQNGNKKNR